MKAEPGQSFEVSFRFSQDDVIAFAKVTGDDNPVHLDEAYAATTAFKKPIMHGFLSASIFSKVFGTQFPGPGSIYLSQTMQFKRPMYVDHDYLVKFEIVETDPAKGLITLVGTVRDERGKECLTGQGQLMNKAIFS